MKLDAETKISNIDSIAKEKINSNLTAANQNLDNSSNSKIDTEGGNSLQSLLDKFLSEEHLLLDQGNSYSCEQCNENTDAEIIKTLTRLPPCLILSLKRFSYDNVTHKRSKIFRKVHFPNEIILPCTVTNQPTTSTNITTDNSQEVEFTKYNLHSAVIHSGLTADGGHYYSIVKMPSDYHGHHDHPIAEDTGNQNGWIIFNDTHVRCDVNSNALDNIGSDHSYAVAYMLFYVQDDFQCNRSHESSMIYSFHEELPANQDLVREVILDNARYAQVFV